MRTSVVGFKLLTVQQDTVCSMTLGTQLLFICRHLYPSLREGERSQESQSLTSFMLLGCVYFWPWYWANSRDTQALEDCPLLVNTEDAAKASSGPLPWLLTWDSWGTFNHLPEKDLYCLHFTPAKWPGTEEIESPFSLMLLTLPIQLSMLSHCSLSLRQLSKGPHLWHILQLPCTPPKPLPITLVGLDLPLTPHGWHH